MLLLVMSLFTAHAQETDTQEQTVKYKARTEIDFEGVEVEGQITKPDGALIRERETARFNPLIKLRTDFSPEMTQSVNEIK